jgi:hypothetical protein
METRMKQGLYIANQALSRLDPEERHDFFMVLLFNWLMGLPDQTLREKFELAVSQENRPVGEVPELTAGLELLLRQAAHKAGSVT